MDDFSRSSWVYLMKDRIHVSRLIENLYNEIKNKFFMSIQVSHMDIALEFMQKDVIDFCLSHDILRQITCPYTSQQNGIDERKRQHLLNIARTLMITVNLLKYLYDDAILYSCYLTNRMPSSVLQGATQFSCLYHDKSLLALTSRVFGCVLCS